MTKIRQKPTTPEEWGALFEDFNTWQFGSGQASAYLIEQPHNPQMAAMVDGWEEARTLHYGCTRRQMMDWLKQKVMQ